MSQCEELMDVRLIYLYVHFQLLMLSLLPEIVPDCYMQKRFRCLMPAIISYRFSLSA